MLNTTVEKGKAYFLSLIHWRTVARAIQSEFKGIAYVAARLHGFINATDKAELKAQNAQKHDEVTGRRRFYFGAGFLIWLSVCLFVFFKIPLGLYLLAWVHIMTFFLIGRSEPVLHKVQTKRMAGEALIRSVFDAVTLPATIRKQGEVSSAIVQPPTRIKNGKGYEVTVRIPADGKPDKALLPEGVSEIAHRLQKDISEIFTYAVKGDKSQVRLLVLDSDPWDAPPTVHPLVRKPQQFNLWVDPANLGVKPDSSAYVKLVVEPGDGGGMLVGGAPRRGKTVFMRDVMVYILLDPRARVHLIDRKGTDYVPIQRVAGSYLADPTISDREFLQNAIGILEKLIKEVDRRRALMMAEGESHITPETCKKLGLFLEFLFIDELAALTSDLMSNDLLKKQVAVFKDKLSYLVRMGPAFGVYSFLGTQRPSDKSVPDEMRSMIIWRIALYVSSQSASHAIMGKAGPKHRADWLDPDQKGVLIAIGEGQVRGHMVSLTDLRNVVDYAAAMRAAFDPNASAPMAVHPEPVRTILSVFTEADGGVLKTEELLRRLAESGLQVNAVTLANSLKPFGISPTKFYVGKVQVRGYREQELRDVPKVVSTDIFELSQPVSETDEDGPEDEEQDGYAANEDEWDED